MDGPKYFYYLGGRKMTLTILAIAVGTAVDLMTDRGLSATFATFLAGAVGAFSAANAVTTIKMASSSSEDGEEQVAPEAVPDPRIPEIQERVEALRSETEQNLQQAANAIQGMGAAIDNLRKVVSAIASGKA
jgi:hypothetical protein